MWNLFCELTPALSSFGEEREFCGRASRTRAKDCEEKRAPENFLPLPAKRGED